MDSLDPAVAPHLNASHTSGMNTSLKYLAVALALVCSATLNAQSSPAPAAPTVAAADNGPKVGDLAPDFTLPAATVAGVSQAAVKLSDLRGRTVVLAFYPRARTRGCTVQMESYRDQYATLFKGGEGVTVLAISTDDVSTLADWAKEQGSPLTFVSDTAAVAGRLYDVKMPALNVLRRVLYVVGPDGRITHVMRPFRELSADSYVELGDAVKRASGG